MAGTKERVPVCFQLQILSHSSLQYKMHQLVLWTETRISVQSWPVAASVCNKNLLHWTDCTMLFKFCGKLEKKKFSCFERHNVKHHCCTSRCNLSLTTVIKTRRPPHVGCDFVPFVTELNYVVSRYGKVEYRVEYSLVNRKEVELGFSWDVHWGVGSCSNIWTIGCSCTCTKYCYIRVSEGPWAPFTLLCDPNDPHTFFFLSPQTIHPNYLRLSYLWLLLAAFRR